MDKAEDINELLDKDKPGVVNYRKIGSVQNAVFKKLMNQYEGAHGIVSESKFEQV